MRIFLYIFLSTLIGGAVGCALVSGKPRHISALEFKIELTSINSAYGSKFIGVTDERAYLERTSLVELPSIIGFGPTVVVYSADLNEFTSEVRESLRRGELL